MLHIAMTNDNNDDDSETMSKRRMKKKIEEGRPFHAASPIICILIKTLFTALPSLLLFSHAYAKIKLVD